MTVTVTASLPATLQSPARFHAAFEQGLKTLLIEQGSVGEFILALANAAMDEALHQNLAPLLKDRFQHLSTGYRETLIQALPLADAPDDILVFLKLMATGLDHLQVVEHREVGHFELQYNPLRSLRPARNAAAQIDTIQAPFNPQGFHFNKPFLEKEIFWQGALLGKKVRLLYNKFPFLPWHGLLVPEPEAEHPQLLTRKLHDYLWDITQALASALPGIHFGYNAYGASASVNHLHFQMFLRDTPLPVEAPHWQHNGGGDAYPCQCLQYNHPEQAWQALDDLHQANQPYNLIYAPGQIYIMPRPFQGSMALGNEPTGYAFYEMAGGLTTFNREDFIDQTGTGLSQALAIYQT